MPASAKMKGRPSVTLTGGLSGGTAVGALLAAGAAVAVPLGAAPPPADSPLAAGAPDLLLGADAAGAAGRPLPHARSIASASSATTPRKLLIPSRMTPTSAFRLRRASMLKPWR